MPAYAVRKKSGQLFTHSNLERGKRFSQTVVDFLTKSGRGLQKRQRKKKKRSEFLARGRHTTDRPTNRPTNRPTDRPTDRPTNQYNKISFYLKNFLQDIEFKSKLRAAPVGVLVVNGAINVGRHDHGRVRRHQLLLGHVHQEHWPDLYVKKFRVHRTLKQSIRMRKSPKKGFHGIVEEKGRRKVCTLCRVAITGTKDTSICQKS